MKLTIYRDNNAIASLTEKDNILHTLGNILTNSRWKIEPTNVHKLKYVYTSLDGTNNWLVSGLNIHWQTGMFITID